MSGSAPARPAALSCGLPEQQPVWIDFADGSVSFWRERFARSGVVIATGSPALAASARADGAGTVHWDMYLRKRVGTPSDPADPALMDRRADSLFDYAVSVTGCQTPLIALNELWGASMPTPLTPTAERYRANVLRFVSRLAQRGGRPALLVSSKPYTDGEAAAWWKSIAAVSDLVLENYANANLVWRQGPIEGSRALRVRHRSAVARLLAIGIPASRIGIMIGFQTNPGSGGREGLQPRSRWFEVAKWHALAARQVARELKLAHVWSWGWAQRDERSNDPDKTYAACVWLWVRDATLCDAPGELGDELNPDVKTGQLDDLAPGVRCTYGTTAITGAAIAALSRLTRDRELALTALVLRAVASERERVPPGEATTVEQRIVETRFGGNRDAYTAALADSRASGAIARGIVADELRVRRIASRLTVPTPTARDVARFRQTYASVLARELVVTPTADWLGGKTGLALATSAPDAVFRVPSGKTSIVRTVDGSFSVRPLDDATELGAVPPQAARRAALRELRAQERSSALGDWMLRMQNAAGSQLVCERDRMPEPGVVNLSAFAPFLSLDEAEAARWAAARGSTPSSSR